MGRVAPEDVVVSTLRVDYAKKEQNPLDHVHFYRIKGDRCVRHQPAPSWFTPR